jgi:1,4-dihydroxy-2-naphthoate octaprenyltransferase
MQVLVEFVGTKDVTRAGFRRGAIAWLMLAIGLVIFMILFQKCWVWTSWAVAAWLVILLLVASSLSVGHPTTHRIAFWFGALFGFVVFGIMFISLGVYTQQSWKYLLLGSVFWVLICGIVNTSLFMLN